ncbi:MAG TPA: cupin domain-containing protein [Mucilaginibacter sp.]
MKITIRLNALIIIIMALPLFFLAGFAISANGKGNGYIIDHEKQLKVDQPGPHDGGGKTTSFVFFNENKDAKVSFRKRILHPGSSIGYHLEEKQEIYYIIGGNGSLQINGKTIPVSAGDGILTMPGNMHGLKPAGNNDLTLLVAYPNN